MKVLFYDSFGGISGDMNLAALIDMGVDTNAILAELGKLRLDGWKLNVSRDSRRGIFGTRADVICEGKENYCHEKNGEICSHSQHHHTHNHRSFADIEKMILSSDLSNSVKNLSIKIFEEIARAESAVHGVKISEVHFHEVGALDSIIDVVGAAVCAEIIGADMIVSSPVEIGGGTVKCVHSVMPVPAPAVAEIARYREVPCKFGGANSERTTPTGMGILAALCDSFDFSGCGKILSTGIGIGHRSDEGDEVPNFLRVRLCEISDESESGNRIERMSIIESNIDDDTPEMLAGLCELLFASGALDAWQEPIVMKKGRMASKVCALVSPDCEHSVIDAFFQNSTTLGIRKTEILRESVDRSVETVEVEGEKIRVKVSHKSPSSRVLKKAEFEDIKNVSKKLGKSTREIAEAAILPHTQKKDSASKKNTAKLKRKSVRKK